VETEKFILKLDAAGLLRQARIRSSAGFGSSTRALIDSESVYAQL